MAFTKKVGMMLVYENPAPTGPYQWLIDPDDFATTGGMRWTGAWSPSTIYAAGSVVTTGGVVYVAKVSNIGVQPPNSTSWDPLPAGSSGGTGIQSITGTPSRIVVTGGPTPQVDISVLYTGQNSITTLGTITTGVWNGTTIAVPKGGSGAITLTGYLKGTGVTPFIAVASIPASDISSGQALTKTDDTNVVITLGGTPATALLAATSITVGWSGTLAAARLNSNVVQAVTSGANVTGSIAAQTLTLGFTGQLAIASGGSGQATANAALNAFLPNQATHGGKVLTTDGTNTAWLATGGVGTVTSIGLTSSDLTVGGDPSPITAAGTFTLTLNTVPYNKGGTGFTSYAQGDMIYASAINVLAKRTVGATGDILSVTGGVPTWITTLGETHGGTNQTSYLQGDLIYASTVNTLAKLGVASGAPGDVLTIGGGNVPIWSPTISVLTTQGDTLYRNSTVLARLPAGTANQVLKTGGAGANPLWAFVAYSEVTGTPAALPPSGPAGGDLTGTYPDPTITTAAVTLAKMANLATQTFIGRNTAGTGVPEALSTSTALAMISPLTTKGDLLTYDAGNIRVGVGSNGQVLTADSTVTGGIKWATPAAGSGTVTSVGLTSSDITVGGATPITTSGAWTLTLNTVGVAKGGTGVTTFTAGVLVSPGTTTALTTVAGTAGTIVKWGTATLADSALIDSSGSLLYTGARMQVKSTEAYNSNPLALYEFRGQYTSGGSLAVMALMEMGKENTTDTDDGGYWSLKTKPSGSAIAERIRVSSTGVVTVSNLTASKPVYTNASKELVSQNVLAVDGGTGQSVYAVGDMLISYFANTLSTLGIGTTGQVLTVVGGLPAWSAPSVGSGTVTSVSVVTANGVSGSVATATTTPAITLTLGAITPTSVISVAAMTLGTSAGNANVLIVPNGTGRIVFGSAGNDIEITQGSNNSAILFNTANARTSYLSSTVPAIYATAGGGSGVFGSAGSLVIQPRTNAQREVDIATFDATNIIRVARFSSSGNVQIGDTITGVNLSGAGGLAVQSATAPASELGAIFTNGGLSAIKGLFLGRTNATLGTIRMAGNTSGYCQIQPAAAAGSWTMTLPPDDGTSGYVLQTDGAGVTTWVAQTGGGGTVTAVTATSPLSSSGGTTPDISLGTVPATKGGTGATSYAVGDTLYADTTTTLAKRTIGSTGNVLTVAGGVPTWAAPSAGSITNGETLFNALISDYATVGDPETLVDFGDGLFEIEITGSGTFRLEAQVSFLGNGAESDVGVFINGLSDGARYGHVMSGGLTQVCISQNVTQAGTTTYQIYAASYTGADNTVKRDGSWISYFKLS